MARTDEYARTGLAAIALALLLPHAAFGGQISIHVSTPEVHVAPPKVHVSTPEFHINRTNNLPMRNYTRVLQQQGRVTLQSDAGSNVSGKIRLDSRTTTVIDTPAKTSNIESASVAFLRNHPFNGGTPRGGSGTRWSELLDKGRINSAFSFNANPSTTAINSSAFANRSRIASFYLRDANSRNVLQTPLESGTLTSRIQQNLGDDLDSMNEMSQMTSMRLQMAMDSRSKFVETLSNMLKKTDKTQDSIVQNMK